MVSLAELTDKARVRQKIGEICVLCASAGSLAAADSEEAFAEHWLGYYVTNQPELLMVALNKQREITAYLSGCLDSAAATRLFDEHAYYAVFEDLYRDYPAHFHINCHPGFQRRGYGRRLVDRYLDICGRKRVPGVHLVTAPGMENLAFYLALGFRPLATRREGDRALLFMGQRLQGPR